MQVFLENKILVVAVWLVLFFVLERLRPMAVPPTPMQRPQIKGRLLRNGILWFCNSLLSPVVILPLTAWATVHTLGWRPDSLDQSLPVLIADLLLLDLLIYWWHRLNHQISFLWRFHEVHHLDSFLDSTSALRFHFGEVLLSALVRAGAVIVLDLSLKTVVIFETFILISTIFHHSNIRISRTVERGLSRVVITPGLHWIHHHAVRRDTDSNYGTVLTCWDRIFGSYNRAQRSPTMPIGVEGLAEKSITNLLLRPFGRSIKKPDS